MARKKWCALGDAYAQIFSRQMRKRYDEEDDDADIDGASRVQDILSIVPWDAGCRFKENSRNLCLPFLDPLCLLFLDLLCLMFLDIESSYRIYLI